MAGAQPEATVARSDERSIVGPRAFTHSSLERDDRPGCFRVKVDTPPDAGHTVGVDDEEHVDTRYRLPWQLRRADSQLPFSRVALQLKRDLHVAVACGQAVRVVVAAKQDDRGNLTRCRPDGDIEVPTVGYLGGEL